METAAFKITVLSSEIRDARIQAEKLLDDTQHWIGIRVSADGKVYVSEEVSYCIGESEFNRDMPHAVTVFGRVGHGQCELPEGDSWEDDMCDVLSEFEEEVAGKLEDAGYEVEIV